MTMTMEIICPSTGGGEDEIESWQVKTKNGCRSIKEAIRVGEYGCDYKVTVLDAITGPEAGFLYKLQQGYQQSSADVLCYFHSDLFIHEECWDERVLKEFEDETVGIVGFGGGKRLGSPDVYKIPYHLQQLARYDFTSNLRDAEKHGRRNRNEETIAVVDSFALIIRHSLLDRISGWPVATYPAMHCSDTWACLMAARHNLQVRMVGVSCTHTSGGVKGDGSFDYDKWQQEIGETDAAMHKRGHRLLYDEFRDVLPVVTTGRVYEI